MVLICAQNNLCVIWWWFAWKTACGFPDQCSDTTWTLRKRQGKTNARKVWMRNPWHLRKHPGAAPSEADKSAEGKGITSIFAQNCFQWKGRSWIPEDLFTRPRHFGFGESRQKLGIWNKACINLKSVQGKKGSFTTWGEEKLTHCWWKNP